MNILALLTILLFSNHAVAQSVEDTVDKKKKPSKKSGFEQVELQFTMNIDPMELPKEQLDYMTAALQIAFDETNPGRKYSATFAYLDHFHDENNGNNPGELRGSLRYNYSTGKLSSVLAILFPSSSHWDQHSQNKTFNCFCSWLDVLDGLWVPLLS